MTSYTFLVKTKKHTHTHITTIVGLKFKMGMKNHDLVPVELIASIAKLRHGGTHKILSTLLTFKLIAHDRSAYDGK